ncbi:MAG TPA: PspC domain-containing protein [Patescibacteria group bacterium]|nr:PspC domain-containing protein [Patescibacteria group bacterium]
MSQESLYQCPKPPRLYRSEDNRVMGGVAAGLAAYFDLDPNFIRLLFILSALIFGVGILVYLFLWILLPTESKLKQPESKNIKENVQDIAYKSRGAAKETSSLFDAEPRVWLAVAIILIGLLFGILTGFGFLDLFGLGPLLLLALAFLALLILIRP